jgi:tetratricopeptide (TPR) repeat protein
LRCYFQQTLSVATLSLVRQSRVSVDFGIGAISRVLEFEARKPLVTTLARPRMHRTLVILLLFLLCACPRGLGTVGPGGPEPLVGWREVRTAHFRIDTDVDPAQLQGLVDELEHMRALVVKGLAGEEVELPGYVRAVIVNDRRFEEIRQGAHVAGYFKLGWMNEPLIVAPSNRLEFRGETLAHELAHHFSWFLFPRQPAWFNEGLATFAQTVAREEEVEGTGARPGEGGWRASSGLGRLGLPPYDLWFLEREGGIPPLGTLLAWDGEEDPGKPSRFHLSGWLLYHYLWDNYGKQLADFEHRLGNAEEPALAWVRSFPEFDPQKPGAATQMALALEDYLAKRRFNFYQAQASFDGHYTEAPLTSAEARAWLLDAERLTKPDEQLNRRIVTVILSEDPFHPMATAIESLLDKHPADEALRKCTAAHPDDWRAWVALGDALPDSSLPEKEQAYRKALELNADAAYPANNLAWLLSTHGRAQDALPLAQRAVDLAPGDASYVDTLANVAVGLGACEQGLSLQRRAAALVPKSQDFKKRLEEYEAKCAAAPP